MRVESSELEDWLGLRKPQLRIKSSAVLRCQARIVQLFKNMVSQTLLEYLLGSKN